MRVSVVATVFNESENIRSLMESLTKQTRQPDEIVICDGGSKDGTVEILQTYADRLPQLRIIRAAGANISQGRNRAIAHASGAVIASTDAGVRLAPRWLEKLVAPIEEGGPDASTAFSAVAGFFLADVDGPFQLAMGATVLPQAREIVPTSFLPSSRSMAFSKELWQRVGGYPDWLDYSEDLVYDLRIKALSAGGDPAFAWAPEAVAHFRPRTTMSAFWKQYFRYARGDGKADLWRVRHAIRFAIYLLLIPALLGHGLWGQVAPWLGWAGLFVGGTVNCARPWRRLLSLGEGASAGALLVAALLVPAIRLVGDLAKITGYPFGLAWRLQNLHRPEIHWREDLPCRAPADEHGK